MKKRISIVMILLFLLTLPLVASANTRYVIDEAGLLTNQQVADLEESCRQFYEITGGKEIVILTVDRLYGISPMVYADDYFDANYGDDGILLLISMEERDWYISTCGTTIDAFPDYILANMEDPMVSKLSEGQYYEAFQQFLSDAEYYSTNEPLSNLEASFVIGLPVGLVCALIFLFILRSTMNTKRPQHSAGNYEVQGSYQLRRQQDLFLYSKVHKQAKPENNSSGSSTHRSSSGATHGGRGGKF